MSSISVSCVAVTVGCNDELAQKSNSFEFLHLLFPVLFENLHSQLNWGWRD